MKCYVLLSSELYGSERFDYDSPREARLGFARLRSDCQREFLKDNIERKVQLVVEWDSEEEENVFPQGWESVPGGVEIGGEA